MAKSPGDEPDLEALRDELTAALERVNSALASQGPASGTRDVKPAELRESRNPVRSVRSVVLDALDDIQWPTYTRELINYCKTRFGREIPATRFGTLGRW